MSDTLRRPGDAVTSTESADRSPTGWRPPAGNPRFPLFDGLRAVAMVCVLLSHTGAQAHVETAWYGAITARLNVGVPIFFAISGFLLYRPYVAARAHGRQAPRLAGYARRRVLRIVPAYWVALTTLAIWPGLTGMFGGDSWRYYAFVQIYDADTFLNGIAPAWTLCVEVSFYVAVPFIAATAARCVGRLDFRRAAKLELWLLLAAALASAALRVVLLRTGAPQKTTQWLPTLFVWFTPGMALAVASVRYGEGDLPASIRWLRRRPGLSWLGAIVAFALLCNGFSLPDVERYPFPDYSAVQFTAVTVLPAIVALLVVAPGAFGPTDRGTPARLLHFGPVAWLGLVSYGVYLWHDPLIYWLDDHGFGNFIPGSPFLSITASTFAVAVAVAAVSYYAVERPLLALKDRLPDRLVPARRPAASTASSDPPQS